MRLGVDFFLIFELLKYIKLNEQEIYEKNSIYFVCRDSIVYDAELCSG